MIIIAITTNGEVSGIGMKGRADTLSSPLVTREKKMPAALRIAIEQVTHLDTKPNADLKGEAGFKRVFD